MNINIGKQHFFAIVPAAGIGRRMQNDQPKQYLLLHNKTVFEHTIATLLREEKLQQIIVPVNVTDKAWQTLTILRNKRIKVIEGGDNRCQSVLNAMKYLSTHCSDLDWILVHDVVRPCITLSDVQLLISQLHNDAVGGILAVPISDTIKQVDSYFSIMRTVDRSTLWQAQTPQMFRYKLLLDALDKIISQGSTITDEASAIELTGYTPKVVQGSRTNIKITWPEDLPLAEFYLQQ